MASFRTLEAQRRAPAAERIIQVAVAAGAAAVLVLPANGRRRSLEVANLGANTIHFGFVPETDATTGYPVTGMTPAGEVAGSVSWRSESAPGGPLYVFSAAGSTVLVREASDPVAF